MQNVPKDDSLEKKKKKKNSLKIMSYKLKLIVSTSKPLGIVR